MCIRDRNVAAGATELLFFGDNGIVMPVFNDVKDADAIEKIQNVFKNKSVVTVPGRPIVEGGGCVHCITQQQPLIR